MIKIVSGSDHCTMSMRSNVNLKKSRLTSNTGIHEEAKNLNTIWVFFYRNNPPFYSLFLN